MIIKRLQRIRFTFSTALDHYYFKQPNQVAILFPGINNYWTQRDIKYNAESVVRGLTRAQFLSGDSILVKLPTQNFQEKISFKIAAANLGLNIFQSKANTVQQIDNQLKETRARAFVFKSFDKLGEGTVMDAIYSLIPGIMVGQKNQEILPRDYYFLRYLIQTDNYSYPGIFKYQQFVKFGFSTDYNFQFNCPQSPIQVDQQMDLSRPILISNPLSELSFRCGILNSLVYGKLLICADPKNTKFISEKFQHKIDIICTEPLTQINNESKVILERGSNLYLEHPKRFQISIQ